MGGWQRFRSPFDSEEPFSLLAVEFAGNPTVFLATFNVPVVATGDNPEPLITVNANEASIALPLDQPVLQGIITGSAAVNDAWVATAGTSITLTGPGGSNELESSSGTIPQGTGSTGSFTITAIYWTGPTTIALRFSNGVEVFNGLTPNLIQVAGQSITFTAGEFSNILQAEVEAVNIGDGWTVTPGNSNTLRDSASVVIMTAASGAVQ